MRALVDVFPGSTHVRELGMKDAPDHLIWDQAKRDGLIIISKDTDFYQRGLLFGHPPKLVWIRRGNCSTATVESILRNHLDEIRQFAQDPQASCLVLY